MFGIMREAGVSADRCSHRRSRGALMSSCLMENEVAIKIFEEVFYFVFYVIFRSENCGQSQIIRRHRERMDCLIRDESAAAIPM